MDHNYSVVTYNKDQKDSTHTGDTAKLVKPTKFTIARRAKKRIKNNGEGNQGAGNGP